MERVLSPDEKLRRAEQIYYQRRERGIQVNRRNKTVNVPISNKKYMRKKMIIQISICLIIYCTYYAVKNFNFIFSNEVINKTEQVLSYDIDIQEIYCKVANYINNYNYFNKKEEVIEEENQKIIENEDKDEVNREGTENESIEETANTETVSTAKVNEKEVDNSEKNLSQMQQDANIIKQKYSLIKPLKGQITSRFGVREAKEEIVSSYHVGLDIAANTGTVFVSSMEGKVVYSGELSGYGNCIQIQKDDVLTIYGHCSKLYVKTGDKVNQGQKIGEVGATGKVTGPHLHFEIRKSGRYVDPEMIFEV